MEHLIERLSELTDMRRQWGNLRHKLVDIVFIGLVSVICGGTDVEHMEDTGYGKLDWFRERLELPNGIPDSDTFRRLYRLSGRSANVRFCSSRYSSRTVLAISRRGISAMSLTAAPRMDSIFGVLKSQIWVKSSPVNADLKLQENAE